MKTIYDVYPSNIAAIAYPFAAVPARIALENGQWDMAANLEFHESEVKWEQFPWQSSLLHFTRAIGSLHLKNFSAASQELEILSALRQQILDGGNEANANQVLIQMKIVQGWLHFYNEQQDSGIALLKEAVEMEDIIGVHGITPGKLIPAREFLAEMLLAMNQPQEALEVYEKNLSVNPNRFNGTYGAAVAAKRFGDQEKRSDRPEVKEAAAFIQQHSS
jgi:tetratricopeptide (TPR) repeat protein